MVESLKITNKCKDDMETYAHFEAINTICRVIAMSRLADQYGCIIYSHYGESATGGEYDSGQDAYKKLKNWKKLQTCCVLLKKRMWLRLWCLIMPMEVTWTNGRSCVTPFVCVWPCVLWSMMLLGQKVRRKLPWTIVMDWLKPMRLISALQETVMSIRFTVLHSTMEMVF